MREEIQECGAKNDEGGRKKRRKIFYPMIPLQYHRPGKSRAVRFLLALSRSNAFKKSVSKVVAQEFFKKRKTLYPHVYYKK